MITTVAVVLGISLSAMAFAVVLGSERRREQQDFDFKAAGAIAALQAEIDSHVAAVHSLQSLYTASAPVSRSEFGVFARNEFTAHPTHPAIKALEWIPRVTTNERYSFEAAVQAEGYTEFSIIEQAEGAMAPAAERLEYFPVTYIEPYSGNEAALGFDLASNPSRYVALKEARDTGEPVATERIVLVQERENQFGFLLFMPVYQRGNPTSTLQQRSDALAGFVLGVFRIDDLVSSASYNSRLEELNGGNLLLFDRSAPDGSQALFLPSGEPEIGVINSGQLAFTDSLSVGGRTWEATITTPQQSLLTIWQPWYALLAGLSLTTILLAYLITAMQREAKTRRLVEQRTRELSEANQQLGKEITDRTKAQRELEGHYEIIRIFADSGDFDSKATAALDRMVDLASADWVTLRLTKETDPGLHLVAAAGPAVADYPPLAVFTQAQVISTAAFTEGRIIVIDDYVSSAAACQRLVDLGMQSMVILPVKVGDRTLGLVTVISQSKSHFSTDLVDLLSSLVDGLGVLVENSMLHDETEKAHEELQQLAEELSHSNQELEQFADILEERVELRSKELVTARERASRSEKLALIGQLSGGIAHDLRNPLNAIKNGAELVKRKINAGPSIENSAMITECLEIIDSEITDANEIITGLLSCGSNKQLSFSSIRIGDVIQDCFGSFVLNENIVLSITINTDLPPVLGDASQLTRVLQNLAGNAQDAMEAGGRLSISAQHRDQFVEIVITDTGGGIDAENIDRVFEPLFSDKPHGTGLGLAICHEIIDKHKGAISVESKIGTGTSFTIQIPVTNSENSDLAA